MKYILRLLVVVISCFAGASFGQDASELAAGRGELIIKEFASAPFPHPLRANGHKYGDTMFSAAEHYNDSHVGIFIPKGFKVGSKIDFVVHFHGWRHNVTNTFEHYKLIQQFVDSKRNAILIVPQGPFDAPDSFDGKLEDPNGFHRFMDEAMETLRKKDGFHDAKIGDILLSGHSGGYQVISSIVAVGGLTDHVKEVWLFDALYARTEKYMAWFDHSKGRFLDIYTEHGGTKGETEALMKQEKEKSAPFFAGKEAEATAAVLSKNRMVFMFSDLPHDEVMQAHSMFQKFLETSCLKPIP